MLKQVCVNYASVNCVIAQLAIVCDWTMEMKTGDFVFFSFKDFFCFFFRIKLDRTC